jgi:hypothetical protein
MARHFRPEFQAHHTPAQIEKDFRDEFREHLKSQNLSLEALQSLSEGLNFNRDEKCRDFNKSVTCQETRKYIEEHAKPILLKVAQN